VIAQEPNAPGDVVGIGRDEAGIAERIEDLERMSREAPHRPQRSGPPAAMLRPHRLGGILDDRQAMARGDRPERVHVADPAPQMTGHPSPPARRDRQFHGVGPHPRLAPPDVYYPRGASPL